MSATPAAPDAAYRDAQPADANDPEVRWLREVYQGDHSRQLTVRAVIAGMLLGGIMSLSNLYIALNTGWIFGVTITAGILAFVIAKGLHAIGHFKTRFGMQENNAMQSVASAAGYSSAPWPGPSSHCSSGGLSPAAAGPDCPARGDPLTELS